MVGKLGKGVIVYKVIYILLCLVLMAANVQATNYVNVVVPVGTDPNDLAAGSVADWSTYPAITNVVFEGVSEPSLISDKAQMWAEGIISLIDVTTNMTGYTTPAPVEITTDTASYTTYYHWKAFDGVTNNSMGALMISAASFNITYDCGTNNSVNLGKYDLTSQLTGQEARAPKDWYVVGSNYGAEVVLDTVINETSWGSYETRTFYTDTTNSYRYLTFRGEANNGDVAYTHIGEIRWFNYNVTTELRVMDSAGNITTISPHSTSLFPKQLREKRRLTFTHYEKSVELDYEMNIDMIGFVKFMEKHYNRQWIYSRKLSDPTDTNVVWELDN